MIHYQCNKVDSATEKVTIFNYPDINLGNDTSICNTCTLLLDGGDDLDYWIWQDGSESQFYEAADAGEYSVLVSKDGCQNGDTIIISQSSVKVTMPNAFSPNSDGINDVFKAVNNKPPSTYQLMIFDRQGRMLYQTEKVDEGWDGTYEGRLCMMGVYVYKVVYEYYEDNLQYQYEKRGTLVLVQ